LLLVIGRDLLRGGEAGQQVERLRSLGTKVIETETDDEVQMVESALSRMGEWRMTNVMVEGGGELIASFFAAGQIDECHVYIGPRAFGGREAPGPIGGTGIARLRESPEFRIVSLEQIGEDVQVVYRRSKSL
jgi:diaminohydroxyphosphoribosylaminopyrimidine deaminase/5-amino-6-(5-phosphoribosylamino)uracil reductase